MQQYKVTLAATGCLTQLPDSQKIFGALVYMFADKYGRKQATILTKSILDKSIHIALSSMIPFGYLPMPQDFFMDGISVSKDTTLKEKCKEIKKRSYIKIDDLQRELTASKHCYSVYPYVEIKDAQQRRVSIDSSRYNMPELDSSVYSVPFIKLSEKEKSVNNNSEQSRPVNLFCFYVQTEGSSMSTDFIDIINLATTQKDRIILGKRASQGLNTFEFINIEKQSWNADADYFLNLGKLLPDKIDFTASTLKLFTSERRPFDMAGGWEKSFTKQFISFIAEGSIIYAPQGVLKAGKSISSPFNPTRDIVFGNALLYPIQIRNI